MAVTIYPEHHAMSLDPIGNRDGPAHPPRANGDAFFPWTRYWSQRGDRPTLTNDYLVSPATKPDWFSAGQGATLKTLRELSEVPCLVLLGDPGTGKSNEIAAEAARLVTLGRTGYTVKRLDLKLRTEALIEKQVFQSPEFVGWTEGRHALALFFDSMDECWRRVPELGPVIIAALEPHLNKPLPPLYLRLGCRAAEWREEIENDLRTAFGEDKAGEKVQVWELAPLTEEDVQVAAASSGLDAAKFLGEVQEREVNAFAAHPITLRMLLATAKAGGALGRDRAEIYQKGCTLLCRDHHQDEKGPPRLTTTVQERLAGASYLAALGVLSNRYLVFGSTERPPEEEAGIIAAQDVLGQKTLLPGANVEFTRVVLAESLQTGLFDAQSGDLFSWRHQSYAEYLAASYLLLRGIPAAEIVQSLCDTTTGRPRLWPQVEETACWLAPLVPEVFNLLVDDNAEVFIRCDPVRLGLDHQARIVTGYLDQVRGHQAQADWGRETTRLNRLAHPGLVHQLAPILADQAQDIFLRDLAMDLVRACQLRELTDQLIAIMFTPAEPERLRHGAAITVRQWADAEIRTKVLSQLKPELLDSDDVRGCVLGTLWPGTLTEEELVPFLTKPVQDNYVGSYQIFLGEYFRAGLAQADLVPLIRWARQLGEDADADGHGPYDGAGSAVFLAAFRSIEKPEVRAEFMPAVKETAEHHRMLFKREDRNLAEEQPWRKIFWRELIAGELPIREIIITAHLREVGLVEDADFDWVVDEATAANPRERERWLELVFWIFRPTQHVEQISRLEPFAAADKAVADRLLHYTTSQLIEHGEPNWQKDQYYRDEKTKVARAQRKPIRQLVDEMLTGYETTQQPNFIWGLVKHLAYPVKDWDEPGGHNMSDVGWKHLTGEQRQRIISLAPGFIASVTVNPAEVYDPEHTFWSYVAGVSFLLELLPAGSPWPTAQPVAFWEAWASVIFQYQDKVYHADDETWQPLLQLAFAQAKPAFLAALTRWLAERGDHSFSAKRFDLLPIGRDPALEEIFLTHALQTSWKGSGEFDLYGFLLRHHSERTEKTLLSWLPAEGSPPHEKGPLAGALLLSGRPAFYARDTIDRVLQNPAWGKQVFFHLASMGGVRSNWLGLVDAERLARVWEFLDREFPGDPHERGGGLVTAEHELAIFRSHLITYLQKRGTPEVIEALRGLLRRHPDYSWLGQVLAQSREIVRRESWHPPSSRATIAYLARTGTPPLCNDADLADAVNASLARYQVLLQGPNPPTELWNESAGPVKDWTPKDENNVSDCLARHLARDLMAHQVNVTRETELRQGNPAAPGDEPDLLVAAPNASGNGEQLSVVIEVKCSWNTETVTGMEQQLLSRYLRALPCGIYVVAHFNCAAWSNTDSRRRQMLSGNTLADLTATLEVERQRLLATTTKRLDLFVLNASV